MSHKEKIARISDRIKNIPIGSKASFIKKSVSHQVPKSKSNPDNRTAIDISDLDEIIEINARERFCVAEPGVPFSTLVKETLKHGLVPITVPELKTITVGGAVAGGSVESMSFKYGGFHDNCLEYEVIDGKGDIIICSPENNSELFHMVHGTFRTIGLITKIKFRLIPSKPFIHVLYCSFESIEEYIKAIKEHSEKNDFDFMDGIIHTPNNFVLCLGNFRDSAPYSHSYDWPRIFYKSTAKRKEDYMKTTDYFFRYDAGCHWTGRNYGLDNPLIRFLFGKIFLPSDRMLSLGKWVVKTFKITEPDIVVDTFFPIEKFKEFFEFYLREFNDFPIWIVPYKIVDYPWINPNHLRGISDNLLIDFAIYGMKEKKGENHYRIMEEELLKLPGLKTLISHNFFTEEEFWRIWNKETYARMKEKTDPRNIFGDLYQKAHQR
ncbi:MAG: FAD-binding oxidoreductase [Candidatus Colwellbacteria bacterium]|nr:FAD-binding oxidoreductase [Candidatus Colwellbacteria bacterium]